jgi:uncharacterized membrane protein
MNLFEGLLLVIGLALSILCIWNLVTLHQLKKNSSLADTQLNDSKYFELKYKLEFTIAVFTFLVGIAAYLGYNSKESIETKVTNEIDQ